MERVLLSFEGHKMVAAQGGLVSVRLALEAEPCISNFLLAIQAIHFLILHNYSATTNRHQCDFINRAVCDLTVRLIGKGL